MVRQGTMEDLRSIAELHTELFPDARITKLGKHIVERYYRWHMIGADSMGALVAESRHRVIGFCVIVKRNNRLGFAISEASALLRACSLRAIFSTLGSWRQVLGGTRWPKLGEGRLNRVLILSMGVGKPFQRHGVARALLTSAIELAQSEKAIVLDVDPRNLRAVALYERLGWRKMDAEPIWRGRMIRSLTD